MTEHPIIFSTNMVKAILDGTKTMTRRVITPQPTESAEAFVWFAPRNGKGYAPSGCWYEDENGLKFNCKCPYGQVGDRLWVRETWASEKRYDYLKPSEIPDTAKIYFVNNLTHSEGGYSLFVEMGKVRSSMFMCEWMSRITLEITEVRVERLQGITIEDIYKEGIRWEMGKTEVEIKEIFKSLWDSLNAKRGYGWEINPWVWVISFRELKGGQK